MSKYTKCTPERIEACAAWIRQHGLGRPAGATIETYAHANGFSPDAHVAWLRKNKAYHDAVEAANAEYRERTVGVIESRIMQLAQGMTSVKTEAYGKPKENDPNSLKTERVKRTTVEVPPSLGACIFLLTNLAPDVWKNKTAQELTGSVGVENPVINFSSAASMNLDENAPAEGQKEPGNGDESEG